VIRTKRIRWSFNAGRSLSDNLPEALISPCRGESRDLYQTREVWSYRFSNAIEPDLVRIRAFMKDNCSSRATGPVFLGHFWLERGVDGETQLPCFRETATRGKKIA